LHRFRPGLYVRIIISKMPCEFIDLFDPHYPVIVGGLLPTEETLGFMQVRTASAGGCLVFVASMRPSGADVVGWLVQVRLKKHRWHSRILKNGDPLIFSVGWRRFQSIPMFSIKDDGQRNRTLKYTPKHMHCMAVFFGTRCAVRNGWSG